MLELEYEMQLGKLAIVQKRNEIRWSMTLTDMRLTEYMGLTEKCATTELFIC